MEKIEVSKTIKNKLDKILSELKEKGYIIKEGQEYTFVINWLMNVRNWIIKKG